MAGAVSCFRMAAPPDPSSAKVAAGGIRSVRPRFLAGQPRGSAQALSFVAMDDLDHCDSCGDRAPDVVAVHRAYLTPAARDTAEKVEVHDDVERWCSPCSTSYPHPETAEQPQEVHPPQEAGTARRGRTGQEGGGVAPAGGARVTGGT